MVVCKVRYKFLKKAVIFKPMNSKVSYTTDVALSFFLCLLRFGNSIDAQLTYVLHF